jgi:NAD(P)H-dependent FMN reductase
LTALIALKDEGRRARVTARWLQRWLEANDDATIGEVVLAATALQALGGRHHQPALSTLRALAAQVRRGSRAD